MRCIRIRSSVTVFYLDNIPCNILLKFIDSDQYHFRLTKAVPYGTL
jgi:hypothetical protein